jgi:uncharacterized protein (TIGR02246 family)
MPRGSPRAGVDEVFRSELTLRSASGSANATWNAAFNSKDAAGLAAMYDRDATVSPGNGKYVRGREAIQSLYQGFFEAGANDHTLQVVDARRHGNMLYEVVTWSAAADKDGKHQDWKGVGMKVMVLGKDDKWHTTAQAWNAAQ